MATYTRQNRKKENEIEREN